MSTELLKTTPYGLFRYLYNHFQVRYPEMCPDLGISPEAYETIDGINSENLETHLKSNSWLIGIVRPDLAESVQALWGSMTPLAQGNYLAGSTEWSYRNRNRNTTQLAFIQEQLNKTESVEFTADAACQIGCALLAMGDEDTFNDLLQSDVNWEQEIERANEKDAKRWKPINRLSKRVIDVFLEAALILNLPKGAKLALEHGADPNIHIWQLERSSNALYPALSYAIKHNIGDAVDALIEYGADPRGSESAPIRSPLALAFQRPDFSLIKRLLASGASLEDGPRYTEAPAFYGKGDTIEWVKEQLSEQLALLPIESKPLFHSPHAQGGFYYTLLQCVWDDPKNLALADEIGMDLRLTEHEMAKLIRSKQYATFCNLVGRLGESIKNEALAKIQKEWPDFSQ